MKMKHKDTLYQLAWLNNYKHLVQGLERSSYQPVTSGPPKANAGGASMPYIQGSRA